MHTDLESHWAQAESLKVDLLARVAAMPENARVSAPQAGEWSPLQVLSHLLVAEQFVTGYAVTKAGEAKRPANPLVIGLLCRVLRAGIALPAPAVMEPDPTPVSLEIITVQWGAERQRLQQTLADMPPGEPFGLHPYFGVVTARQVMEMLAAHMLYHVKRFPKAAR